MYTELRVEFTAGCSDEMRQDSLWPVIVREFQKEYQSFLQKNLHREFEQTYIFRDDLIDFEKIFQCLLPCKDEQRFSMHLYPVWEEADFQQAAAVLIYFPREGVYHNDVFTHEKYKSLEILCNYQNCWVRGHKDKVYISPQDNLKRTFTSQYAGVSTAYGLHMISPLLKEHLQNHGIDQKYLRPVYQKNGTVWAYYLEGGDHLLPTLSILDGTNDRYHICPGCGRCIVRRSMICDQKSLWNEFPRIRRCGVYPASRNWEIKTEALSDLKPVNLTEDYFDVKRHTVVSRDVFRLIAEKFPQTMEWSAPVFEKNYKVNLEDGRIIKF